jgi:hypothetical protein
MALVEDRDLLYNNSMRGSTEFEGRSKVTDKTIEAKGGEQEEVDERSHYAKYTKAHKKYEGSAKGKIARKRYMSSPKGKAARKRYQSKRQKMLKQLLKEARESGRFDD